MCFGPDQPHNWSDSLKNGDCLGIKWQGWSRKQPMIPLPAVVNLSYKLILKFRQCSTSLEPYAHVFWARPATKLVQFPQKRGLENGKVGVEIQL